MKKRNCFNVLMFSCFHERGFGILEVVIAMGIITMGMIGVISLIVQNTQVYYINKTKFTAVMLAQEGVELVRNIRDSNWLRNNPENPVAWNDDITGDAINHNYAIEVIYGDGGIDIDESVNSIEDARLYFKSETDKRYIHTPTSYPTPFYRIIETDTTDCPDVNDCLRVISHVRWKERGNTHEHQTEVYLYDWK